MEQPHRAKRSGWIIAIVAVFVLPLLYALSVGPVVWLEVHGYLLIQPIPNVTLEEFLFVLYTPLRFLYDYSPAFASLMDWYIGLWFT